MINCLECNKELKRISHTHLKCHNMTVKDYRKKYPGAKIAIFSEEHKKNISKNHIDVSGKNNPMFERGELLLQNKNGMFGKSILDVWKEKYGEEKAAYLWELRRKKLSGSNSVLFGLTGDSNHRFGISIEDIWKEKYGDSVAKKMWEEHCIKHLRGENNPCFGLTGELNASYGISPSILSSQGLQGYLNVFEKRMMFRSSLELKIFLFLLSKNIEFDLCDERIKYITKNGNSKTYLPDIKIGNTIYEIKQSCLVDSETVQEKFEALQRYCLLNNLKCEFITEKTYEISFVNKEYVNMMIENGKVELIQNVKNLSKYNRIFVDEKE